MLLWVMIIALAIPYLIAMVPTKVNPVKKLEINSDQIQSWLRELDPQAFRPASGASGMGGPDGYSDTYDFTLLSKTLTADEMFKHICEKIRAKINETIWEQNSAGMSKDRLNLYVSNAFAAYRIYMFKIPLNESEQQEADAYNANALRIKLISISYSTSHGQLRAKDPVSSNR